MIKDLRKTKYGKNNQHYFEDKRGDERELPWRKWIRENLPRGPQGFVFEDVDGVAVLFDPKTHVNKRCMLIEFKWWDVKLDRAQVETLQMLDGLLRAGDPQANLYRGVYVVEWWDEVPVTWIRVNYRHMLDTDQLKQFFLFQHQIPSYFGG